MKQGHHAVVVGGLMGSVDLAADLGRTAEKLSR